MNCEILCLRIWSDEPIIANEILSYSIYFHCLIKSPSYLQKAADLRLFSVKQRILRFEATTSHLKYCQICLSRLKRLNSNFSLKIGKLNLSGFTLNSLITILLSRKTAKAHQHHFKMMHMNKPAYVYSSACT